MSGSLQEALSSLSDDLVLRTALDLLVRTSAVLSLTLLGTHLLRRRTTPATRHALLLGAVVGALALPLLVWVLPSVEVTLSGDVRIGSAAHRHSSPATIASGAVIIVWTTGALILLLRLLVGIRCLARWTSRAGLVTDSPWTRLVALMATELGIRRSVDVFADDDIETPATWGMKCPLVLLPVSADSWPRDRRRRVLLHELAHVRRRDCLTQTVARIACALLWFHPLVWWCERRMREEREAACDAAVVAAGERPSSYAADLLALIRGSKRIPHLPHAAVPLGGGSELEARLRALLSRSGPRHESLKGSAVAMMAGCLTALAAVVTPVPTDGGRPQVAARPDLHAAAMAHVRRQTGAEEAPIGATPGPTVREHAVVASTSEPAPLTPDLGFLSERARPATAEATPAADPGPPPPPDLGAWRATERTDDADAARTTAAPVVVSPRWVDLPNDERHLPSTRLHPRKAEDRGGLRSTYSFVHETRDDRAIVRGRWDLGLIANHGRLQFVACSTGPESGIVDLGPGSLVDVGDHVARTSELRAQAEIHLGHVYLQHVVHGADADFWVAIKPFATLPDDSVRLTWRILGARSVPGRVVLPHGAVLPIGRPADAADLALDPEVARLERTVLRTGRGKSGLIVGRNRPRRSPDLWLEQSNGALHLRAHVETARLFALGPVPIRKAGRHRMKEAVPTLRIPATLGQTFVLHLRESHGDQLVRFRVIGVDPAGAVTLVRAPMPP